MSGAGQADICAEREARAIVRHKEVLGLLGEVCGWLEHLRELDDHDRSQLADLRRRIEKAAMEPDIYQAFTKAP